jgi:hypothetical protein
MKLNLREKVQSCSRSSISKFRFGGTLKVGLVVAGGMVCVERTCVVGLVQGRRRELRFRGVRLL